MPKSLCLTAVASCLMILKEKILRMYRKKRAALNHTHLRKRWKSECIFAFAYLMHKQFVFLLLFICYCLKLTRLSLHDLLPRSHRFSKEAKNARYLPIMARWKNISALELH